MKLILVISVLFIACNIQSQKLSEADKAQIKAEVKASFDSLVATTNEQNWEEYFGYFDKEKFSGINADGTIWESFEEFKTSVAPGFQMIQNSDSLSFPVVSISIINGNTVILVNEYEQKIFLKNSQDFWAYGAGTQVWSKETGEWKLVSISASSK